MAEIDEILDQLRIWERAPKTSQRIALRCRIILCYQKRKYPELVSQDLGCHWHTAQKWTKRWTQISPKIVEFWNADGFQKKKILMEMLQDKQRSGRKPNFNTEQITQIIALACRPPSDFERPITHWTHRELADEIVKQGIADKISPTSVGRFLKSTPIKTSKIPLLVKPKN